MRVGPSLDYPSNWVYRRRDLPVKVVQVLGNWRKIEDSTGTQGWMHVRLLSDTATALVIGATADKMRFYPGFACTVTGVVSAQLKGTVATGAATTTLTTTAGSPTGNSITHAIGETVNQKKTMAPSGANCVVGATDFIELAITGTNDGANSKAGYTIQYTRT